MSETPVVRGQLITCRSTGVLGDALTRGKKYAVLLHDPAKRLVYLQDDGGRRQWFSERLFDLEGQDLPVLAVVRLDDEISDPLNDCIEVTLTLTDGRQRWCFFSTPRWLAEHLDLRTAPKIKRQGDLTLEQLTVLADWLQDAQGTPFGVINVPHLVVISRLNADTIGRALRHMDETGQLLASSVPLE